MPYISVVISTYNSSRFIIETLESILQQTWQDIEIIITDDCSSDDTVDLTNSWLSTYGLRFRSYQVITSKFNSGISANANRGLKAATGEWIKFLGADDSLLPDCLADNMCYVNDNADVRVLFSKVNIYKEEFKKENYISTEPKGSINHTSLLWSERTAASQYRMLLVSDRLHFTPSVFIHRNTINDIGGFDERFCFLEDYPLWLKLTKSGYKLHFMDKVTVNYRKHSAAITNADRKYLINPHYFRDEGFRRIYIYPNLPLDIRLLQRSTWFFTQPFCMDVFNRDKQPNRFLYELLTIYLNPFKYYIWLKKHLLMRVRSNEFYM